MDNEKHIAFLRKRRFLVPESVCEELSATQLGLLVRYGHWLEAMANEVLAPLTPEQAQFVRASKGQIAAVTDFEIAWVKYRPPGSYKRPRAPEPDDFEDMGSCGEEG